MVCSKVRALFVEEVSYGELGGKSGGTEGVVPSTPKTRPRRRTEPGAAGYEQVEYSHGACHCVWLLLHFLLIILPRNVESYKSEILLLY